MEFNRGDVMVSSYDSLAHQGLAPVDLNDPASASTAIGYTLPLSFSEKAWACWRYFDGTAFLYEYKGQLVVTDESLYLTICGDGTHDSPFGCPRHVCDSWEGLELFLEEVYDELHADGEI